MPVARVRCPEEPPLRKTRSRSQNRRSTASTVTHAGTARRPALRAALKSHSRTVCTARSSSPGTGHRTMSRDDTKSQAANARMGGQKTGKRKRRIKNERLTTKSLVQPEGNFDRNNRRHGPAIGTHGGFELPTLYRLDGFFFQAQTRALDHGNVDGAAVGGNRHL